MIKLGPSTVDRAPEIITAHLVIQMRAAKARDKQAPYKSLKELQAYAVKCAKGYTKNLKACRDLADHEILYQAVKQMLSPEGDEYTNA